MELTAYYDAQRALIGAALSAAGASYQAMFRNPMVSPDLLGAYTTAGAACACWAAARRSLLYLAFS